MKKLIVIAVVLITGVFVIYFIPVSRHMTIKIAASAIKVSMQLNNPDNWKKWHPGLKTAFEKDSTRCSITRDFSNHSFKISTPLTTFSVQSPSSIHLKIKSIEKSKSLNHDVFIISTPDINESEVVIQTKTSLLRWLFSFEKNQTNNINFMDYLKKFIENDSLYYGFPIEIRKVADTNVVVLNRLVATEEKFTVLDTMFKELNAYISFNHLTIVGSAPMMQYNDLPSDSVSVLTMLSVNKKTENKNEIRSVRMPVNGRMLVGHFEGKYKDRIKLKTAMQQYILDKNITSIVNTYEKFLDGKLPKNEETLVKMEIYFPIL